MADGYWQGIEYWQSIADTSDYAEVFRRLEVGETEALEELAVILSDFPHGEDDRPSPRRWITNAIDSGSITSIRWMLDQGVELHFRDGEGRTPLHACLERQNKDRHKILSLLLAANADANFYGTNGWTPLHMAAIHDDYKAIRILLAAGADPTKRTNIDNYATPAEEARRMGHNKSADIIERKYPYNDV